MGAHNYLNLAEVGAPEDTVNNLVITVWLSITEQFEDDPVRIMEHWADPATVLMRVDADRCTTNIAPFRSSHHDCESIMCLMHSASTMGARLFIHLSLWSPNSDEKYKTTICLEPRV